MTKYNDPENIEQKINHLQEDSEKIQAEFGDKHPIVDVFSVITKSIGQLCKLSKEIDNCLDEEKKQSLEKQFFELSEKVKKLNSEFDKTLDGLKEQIAN